MFREKAAGLTSLRSRNVPFWGNHCLMQGSPVVLEEGVEPSCPVKGAGF